MEIKPYVMQPPNENVNVFESETLIDELRTSDGTRICSAKHDDEYLDILDGRMLSLLLRSSKGISAVLEQLMNSGYGLLLRRKLQGEVLKVFNSQYKEAVLKERRDFINSFLTDHPGYSGDIAPEPSDADIYTAGLIVQKHIALIAEWCMADYSTSMLGNTPDSRNWTIDTERLKPLASITFESIYGSMKSVDDEKRKKLEEEQRKVKAKQPKTEEEVIQAKLKRELNRMKKSGELSDYAKEMLECSDLL